MLADDLQRISVNKSSAAHSWRRQTIHGLSALLLSSLIVPFALAAEAVVVSQRDREFWPQDLKLTRGSVVHIKNDDKVTHHVFVDSPNMSFDSGEQPMGKTVEIKFDKNGRFAIRCAIHPLMRLLIKVE